MKIIQYFAAILLIAELLACSSPFEANDRQNQAAALPQRTTRLTAREIIRLRTLNIDFQWRERCYAYSSDKNAEPHNGEAHSDNLPNPIDSTFSKAGFYLVLNQQEWVAVDSQFLGCKLYLVNTSDSLIRLSASDSRLNIIAEGLDAFGRWKPITYLLSSWCGNSRHTVVLDKGEYWAFDVPVFKGRIKTKLRYSLKLDNKQEIHSNEVIAYLNKGQFDKNRKQGYSSKNIMDPSSF